MGIRPTQWLRKSGRVVGRPVVRRVAQITMRPPARFVIVTTGRSGSNLLVSLLRSHRSIRECGEIVGDWMLRQEDVKADILKMGTVPYVEKCLERQKFESAVGIKILYYQVSQEHAEVWGVSDIPQLLDHLVGDKGFRVIHLKRQNLLKTLISIRVAAVTKQYGLIDEDKKIEQQIELSKEECVEHFEQTRQWEREFEGYFVDHPYMEGN